MPKPTFEEFLDQLVALGMLHVVVDTPSGTVDRGQGGVASVGSAHQHLRVYTCPRDVRTGARMKSETSVAKMVQDILAGITHVGAGWRDNQVFSTSDAAPGWQQEVPADSYFRQRWATTPSGTLVAIVKVGTNVNVAQAIAAREQELGIDAHHATTVQYESGSPWGELLGRLLPGILAAGLLFWLISGTRLKLGPPNLGGASGASFTSVAMMRGQGAAKERLGDVKGIEAATRDIHEIIRILREPAKMGQFGGQIPRGVLMEGPPGTGKTMLARVIASEANVPFYAFSSADFSKSFAGEGANMVRSVFRAARRNAPCVIFIDEIDGVGGRRARRGAGSFTLNQMLTEMDGLQGAKGVMIIGATNFADRLDPALLRPGRLDRILKLQLPDVKGRRDVLMVYLKRVWVAARSEEYGDILFELADNIARRTRGMSPAQLKGIVDEAALLAASRGIAKKRKGDANLVSDSGSNDRTSDQLEFHGSLHLSGKEDLRKVDIVLKSDEIDVDGAVSLDILTKALVHVADGVQSGHRVSEHEKRVVACYEAARTVASWRLPHVPFAKFVSIILTSKQHGGTHIGSNHYRLMSQAQVTDQLTSLLVGRAAEYAIISCISSRASRDLKRATKMVRQLIGQCGFDEKHYGLLASPVDQEDDGSERLVPRRVYSEKTATMLDASVSTFLSEAEERAQAFVAENRDDIIKVMNALVADERLLESEIQTLLGEPAPDPVLDMQDSVNTSSARHAPA